jgi:type IV pilus assembly protein PilC
MTLFKYNAIDKEGNEVTGNIDASSRDAGIRSLQQRGLIISSIQEGGEEKKILNISLFERVSNKEFVVLSRQLATLFEAQVSALRIFRLLAGESENALLRRTLIAVADDLQSGNAISKALSAHPKVFSPFYVSMVRSGEESGQLDKTFGYLADYLDRSYEVNSKARNALIYPAFVIGTFVAVMVLMLTTVIPRLSSIIEESNQAIPVYTKFVIAISNILVNYGIFVLIAFLAGGFFIWRYLQRDIGKESLDRLKISFPYIGQLYRKLYLSRLADNMNTMLSSGIPMVKALEITADVVDNKIYEELLKNAVEAIRGGRQVSDALAETDEIPDIMVQMIKIGEETGELGSILQTLAHFYQREVTNAVDTLVDLIEPVMIVLLGLGVGFLLASVMIPIYNISAGF